MATPGHRLYNLFYHRCAFCQHIVFLDSQDLSKHLRKCHGASFKEYLMRQMKQEKDNKLPNICKVAKEETGVAKAASDQESSSLVIIRCDQCPKLFKQNIQLRQHNRRHLSQSV
jgi:uncharacterized C2H2 Zn-finger protein